MEPEGSLLCSQKPAIGLYPQTDASSFLANPFIFCLTVIGTNIV
jgi:hypothetical protein